ncbi:MAG: hypothetical protein ACREXP_03680 [Steroidobacteraceae bacterium]
MRIAAIFVASLALVALMQAGAAEVWKTPVPDTCPVTRSAPETRFTPPPPHEAAKPGDPMFWFGSDALYVFLTADGRWRGITSPTGTRNKSFWYRKDAKWLNEYPYQLKVTAKRIDADGPMIAFPRVTNAIMGEEVAMLLMLELPERGCWQVTGNYKGDYLAWVTWVD